MFLHIVMMELTDDVDARFFHTVQDYAARMHQTCKGLIYYHFGENIADRAQGYTHAVCAAFMDAPAHDAYQVSSTHMAMKIFMTPYIRRMVVCDMDEVCCCGQLLPGSGAA